VFGVLLWYVLLPGPKRRDPVPPGGAPRRALAGPRLFGRFAQQAFYVLDWPAARLTAAAFAVVRRFRGRGLLLAHPGARLARPERRHRARRRRRRDGCAARMPVQKSTA